MLNMNLESEINASLIKLTSTPLTADHVCCLHDENRLEEAVAMLEELRDRHGLRLPLPQGHALGGPFDTLEEACAAASKAAGGHLVVTVDEMATDESRATGVGNEFYVRGFDCPDASVALADKERWTACWLRGVGLA